MKILLTAVNAKYIHTCPAVYSLKAFAGKHGNGKTQIGIAEYTINDRYQDVLSGILSHHADVIAFSVYIWNRDYICRLIRDIRKICGQDVLIWAGGPEPTYDPETFLFREKADLCMLGEGEETFTRLSDLLSEGKPVRYPPDLPGIAFQSSPSRERKHDGTDSAPGDLSHTEVGAETLVCTGMAPPVALDSIPFLYEDLSVFENRILYYEASRGCPFGCAYCLSGKERGLRHRDVGTVKQELSFFLREKVKQVKFIDRTFNADPAFAAKIWRFLQENDNGVTNFHFEIEADRMTEELLELVSSFRPGLIQMEIGVQSANPDTLRSVNRNPDLGRIRKVMDTLVKKQNINLHLDLIAGLPHEGIDSFRKSFQAVYSMRPHQFQLGFLKLLRGTALWDRREEYGLVCSEDAPYEVLKTKWLSYEELHLLHEISDRLEEFVNTQGFRRSLCLAEELFPDSFSLFENLVCFFRASGYDRVHLSVQRRYEVFAEFIQKQAEQRKDYPEEKLRLILETIRFDRMLHTHPPRRMILQETFDFGEGDVTICFDHRSCSPVNGEALFSVIPTTKNGNVL